MSDPFNLERFMRAQARVYQSVLEELTDGEKRTHWMWYIFPQIQGLGRTTTAQKYAISSMNEAIAYFDHAVLGPRLVECTKVVVDLNGRTAKQIFHSPDYLKFRSCMTLFESAVPHVPIFHSALLKYYDGNRDQKTLDILKQQANESLTPRSPPDGLLGSSR